MVDIYWDDVKTSPISELLTDFLIVSFIFIFWFFTLATANFSNTGIISFKYICWRFSIWP